MQNYDDEVVTGIHDLLERGRPHIQAQLRRYQPDLAPFTIFPGRKVPLSPLPSIEIVRASPTLEQDWFATTVYGSKLNFFLDCSIQSTKETFGEKLASVFGKIIVKWLNHMPNKVFLIPNSNATNWDSQATGYDANYRRGAGLRTARVTYWVKVLESGISSFFDP
jgi:hypothetical protein